MTRAVTIARREYLTNVTRWEFLLLTFGLPLLWLLVGARAMIPVMLMARSIPSHLTVGIVDETGMFDFPTEIKGAQAPGFLGKLAPPRTGYTLRHFATRDEAKAALEEDSVAAYAIVPEDYLRTGHVLTDSRQDERLLPQPSLPPMRRTLIRGLLEDRVEEEILDRVLDPIASRKPAAPRPKRKSKGPLGEMGQMVVPYAFTILMMMAIFTSSGYLLRGISDEKEGRVIEIVLSSVSVEELFLGKLVGLGAVGLTQVAVWLALGVVPAMLTLRFLEVPTAAIVLAPPFFLLGFLLYGSLMAGIGAMGESWRESQQLSAWISLIVMVPVVLFPPLLEAPNGPLATGLSLFPFTAPLVMMIRLSAVAVPWWQLALSVGLLTACVWAVIRTSVRLFRTAILMYGKRPGVREILRWLREA